MRYILVAVKGAGDLASGVIQRLWQAGFAVVASEIPQPTALRRTVAFAEAAVQGEMSVGGLTARRIASLEEVYPTLESGKIPLLVDPDGLLLRMARPVALVEATLSKRNTGVNMNDAPIVVALGPGYEAGKDVHAVVETNRGHNLGRVYYQGCAEPNTGVPGAIGGYAGERLLRAPRAGRLYGVRAIGDSVQAGETVAQVRTEAAEDAPAPVVAAISGVLRGLVRDGLPVEPGMKIGDIDPRAVREHCFTISDKSRAVAGGVLEAIMHFLSR